jgi:hypothetical protein
MFFALLYERIFLLSNGIFPRKKWISVLAGGKKWYIIYSKWEEVGNFNSEAIIKFHHPPRADEGFKIIFSLRSKII